MRVADVNYLDGPTEWSFLNKLKTDFTDICNRFAFPSNLESLKGKGLMVNRLASTYYIINFPFHEYIKSF